MDDAVTIPPCSDEALAFLAEYGTALRPEICFDEELTLRCTKTHHVIGTVKTSIAQSKFKGEKVYFVSILREAKWPDGFASTSVLTSYVSPALETLSESVASSKTSPAGACVEGVLEALMDHERRLVVSESEGPAAAAAAAAGDSAPAAAETSLCIAAKSTRGFILGGSQAILCRLLATAEHPGPWSTLSFYTYMQQGIGRKTFRAAAAQSSAVGKDEPPVSSTSSSSSTKSAVVHISVVDAMPRRQSFALEQQQQQRAAAVVAAAEPPAAADNSSSSVAAAPPKETMASRQHHHHHHHAADAKRGLVLAHATGACLSEEDFDEAWIAEWKEPDEAPVVDESRPSDFLGNIELMSEFYQRKDSLEKSHVAFLEENSDLRSIMADYLQLILHRKPQDVYAFTRSYATGDWLQ
ncbi:hypothetical protein DFJ73DRAFT_894117 [Zopfochytrium polystomum]|nr:hypothetical protein DFJ73DRAFT_894117 [Zopfochytrium polystomum]